MSGEPGATRPTGWWLEEADARLDEGFDAALAGTDVDRRGWQVLSSPSRGPVPRAALVASPASCDAPGAVEAVVDGVRRQVGEALTQDEHGVLVGLPARLVAGLAPGPQEHRPPERRPAPGPAADRAPRLDDAPSAGAGPQGRAAGEGDR